MQQDTLQRTHTLKDVCGKLKILYSKKGGSVYELDKNGKKIRYDAGQNTCFWHSDNVLGYVNDLAKFLTFEYGAK